MADEQKPLVETGGRMPFRYSLGRLYSEFQKQLQQQQSRQLQFKTNAANVLMWKWSDETVWKEAAVMSDAKAATTIEGVSGLQQALDKKRDSGVITIKDIDGLDAALQSLGLPARYRQQKCTGLDDQLSKIGAAPAWSAVTGKPTTFAPSAHRHEIADVNGLRAALDAGLKAEVVEGKVVTAGQKVAVKFAKTYSAPPVVVPNSIWAGTQEVLGQASEVTATGCNVTVMQSTGTLLLNGSPFGTAPAGTTFRMLVIGN